MADYCIRCGIPLAIGAESDYCSEHAALAPSPEATVRCRFCSEVILASAKKCKHCGEFLSGKVAPATPRRSTANYPSGAMYCTSCGHVGKPHGMPLFELLFVLVISIFTLFVPLMIYLLVRSGERCEECKRKSLIPLDSPAARSALERNP
jgi:hypothetical protein